MYQYGPLEEELWEGRRDRAVGVIRLPFYQVLWEREKGEKIWSDRFIAAIEAARDDTPVRPNNYYERNAAAARDLIETGDVFQRGSTA